MGWSSGNSGGNTSNVVGQIVVADFAAIDAYDVDANNLVEGNSVYMTATYAYWVLRLGANPSLTSSATTRSANSATLSYWERVPMGSESWINAIMDGVDTVFVNASTGSDDNDGSSTTPLATIGEFIRRTAGISLQDNYVEIDITGNVTMDGEVLAPIGYDAYIQFTGHYTAIGNAAVTTTPFNRGAAAGGAGSAPQQYAATIAGQPLYNYRCTGAGNFYRLSDNANPKSGSAKRGWIGDAYLFPTTTQVATFNSSGRASIDGGTIVYVTNITSVITTKFTADLSGMGDGWIAFDTVGFNNFVIVFDGQAEFDHCFLGYQRNEFVAMKDVEFYYTGFSSLYSYASTVILGSCCFPYASGSAFKGGKVDSTNGLSSFNQQMEFTNGCRAAFDDLEIRMNTGGAGIGAGHVYNATVTFSAYLWGGPANSGSNQHTGWNLSGPGAFVGYADATKITMLCATELAKLTTTGGSTTSAVNGSNLPVAIVNSFIGFVN